MANARQGYVTTRFLTPLNAGTPTPESTWEQTHKQPCFQPSNSMPGDVDGAAMDINATWSGEESSEDIEVRHAACMHWCMMRQVSQSHRLLGRGQGLL